MRSNSEDVAGPTRHTFVRRFAPGIAVAVLLGAGLVNPGRAQEPADGPWRTIVVRDSVRVAYLFYPDADGRDGGVVVLLRNRGAASRCVSFDLTFQAQEDARSASVSRCLAPGEGATGELDDLFWIPFDDGRRIDALVLRRLRVWPCLPGGACGR